MSTQEYDQLEKMICGRWKYDRDENLDEYLKASEMLEAMKEMYGAKPDVIFKREETTVMGPGVEIDVIFKLNETMEWKEGDTFHVKATPSFKDGAFIQDIVPMTASAGKKHTITMRVKENELTGEFRLGEEPYVTGKRIYKKC